jgi:hypothetical protein
MKRSPPISTTHAHDNKGPLARAFAFLPGNDTDHGTIPRGIFTS